VANKLSRAERRGIYHEVVTPERRWRKWLAANVKGSVELFCSFGIAGENGHLSTVQFHLPDCCSRSASGPDYRNPPL
jgi:hypothetical protein